MSQPTKIDLGNKTVVSENGNDYTGTIEVHSVTGGQVYPKENQDINQKNDTGDYIEIDPEEYDNVEYSDTKAKKGK
jgi:hypothetical protein